MFKSITTLQRTGVIATVEVYKKGEEDRTAYFFLTKKGEMREPTNQGNKKITSAKAEKLTGKNGLGWLHELHKEQNGNKYLDRDFGEYEIDICQDLDVYCEEDDEDYKPYQITALDMTIAEELHYKQL